MEEKHERSFAAKLTAKIKLPLELAKLCRQAVPTDGIGRRSKATSLLDISYEADGQMSLKLKVMNELKKLYEANPEEAHLRTSYAYGIHYTVRDATLSPQEREAALESFNDLSKNFNFDEKVRELYADSICQLICDSRSDIARARRLYSRLKRFSQDFPHCRFSASALSYSASRLHHFEILDNERQLEYLAELREAYSRFPQEDSISYHFGAALHNTARCETHSEEQLLKLLDEIEDWQAVHKPDEFLIETASVWRSSAMIEGKSTPALKKKSAQLFLKHVKRLHEFPPVRDYFAYAASNFLLGAETFEEMEQDLVDTMRLILDLYPREERIIEGWRRTLHAIACAPNGALSISRSSALEMLRQSIKQGPFHEDGLGHLALALTHLTRSNFADEKEKEDYVTELAEIAKDNPDYTGIQSASAIAYLLSHGNRANSGEPAEDDLSRLRELCRQNPQNQEILAHFGNALMNGTTCPGQPDYCKKCLAELKELQKEFPKNQDLVNLLAIAFFNIFSDPPFDADLSDIQDQLEILADKHPKNTEVALSLALVYFSGFLGNIDRVSLRFFCIRDLKDIAKRFPDEEEIQWRYSLCLMVSAVISRPVWNKKRLMKEAEKRDLYAASREFPSLAPFVNYAARNETLTPAEVKQMLNEEDKLPKP